MSTRHVHLIACGLLSMALSAFAPPAEATEEPAYTVERQFGEVEVRAYAPYLVAEMIVPGPAAEAGNQAFPVLAGYIFGKNKGSRKLAMTAPVTQKPVKLSMTAPVTQAEAPGGFLVQFVLPRGTTLDAAPVPLDSRIVLREVPASRVAVIRYSGFWSESNYQEHLQQLDAALRQAGLAWVGEPVYSRYNAPFTPWFMRRNEVWRVLTAP